MKRCPKCGKTYADEANFCPTDAGRLVAVEEEAPAAAAAGLVGGRFELGALLGGGRTGPVHRATDTTSGAAVAVKLVSPDVVAIAQVAQRIERELKQLERVQHRAVPRVLASGRHDQHVFVATELVGGGRPLSELLAASGAVDPQRASELVLTIGEALIEAAKVGVVHRDLAPKNILITHDAVKVINFAVPVPGEQADQPAGVPAYLAPEAIEGKPVDQRSNIYSLAAIYYALLTGRAPYDGAAADVLAAHLAGSVEAPSVHAAVPADVDALVVRALERSPAKRFLTLRQFLDDVDRVARGPEGGAGATAPFGRAGKTKELASTLMGFGFPTPGATETLKTRQIDVQIPPEAVREPAAPIAPIAVGPAPVAEPAPAAPIVAAPSPVAAAPVAAAPVAAAPVVAAPVAAAPVAAAPVAAAPESPWARAAAEAAEAAPAAPVVAAPRVTGAPAGKKKADEARPKGEKGSKGKFRETMWFKKGELDAAAAEEAAATGDADAAGKADLLPIEERYSDDGTITRSDAEKYSLKTGATAMMQAMRDDEGAAAASISERELVGEMKGGRNVVLVAIVIGLLAAAGIVAAFVL